MFLKQVLPILIGLFLLAGVVYFLWDNNDGVIENNNDRDEEYDEGIANGQDEIEDYLSIIDLTEGPSMGDADAPVKMVNYSSYYCPFCAQFKKDVFPEIKEKYIDTGKVEYFYRDSGSPDDPIFLAAHCARAEDLFWEYQDVLISEGVTSEDDLYAYAEDFDLDMEKFRECLEDGCCADIIEQAQHEMEVFGVSSIPYFVINQTTVSGLSSVEEFFEIIESELANYE